MRRYAAVELKIRLCAAPNLPSLTQWHHSQEMEDISRKMAKEDAVVEDRLNRTRGSEEAKEQEHEKVKVPSDCDDVMSWLNGTPPTQPSPPPPSPLASRAR